MKYIIIVLLLVFIIYFFYKMNLFEYYEDNDIQNGYYIIKDSKSDYFYDVVNEKISLSKNKDKPIFLVQRYPLNRIKLTSYKNKIYNYCSIANFNKDILCNNTDLINVGNYFTITKNKDNTINLSYNANEIFNNLIFIKVNNT
jgi:hypothetical protein